MLKLKSIAVILLGLSCLPLSAQTIDGAFDSNEKYGLKAEDGHYILPKIYDRIALIPAENPRFIVWQNGYFGITDQNGKFIIPIEYEAANNNDDCFSTDGDVAYFDEKTVFTWRNKAGKVGLIQDYKTVVPFEYDEIAVDQYPKDDGTGAYLSSVNDVLLEKGNKVFRMDWKTKKTESKPIGTSILGIDFANFIYVQNGKQIDLYHDKEKVAATEEHNSACIIHDNGKYGVIRGSTEIMIPTTYSKIIATSIDDRWIVSNNGKWGLISDKNEVLIPLKYDEITYIYTGHFRVKQGNSYAVFEDNGKAVTGFEYDYILPYKSTMNDENNELVEFFTVKTSNGKMYYLSAAGKIIREW